MTATLKVGIMNTTEIKIDLPAHKLQIEHLGPGEKISSAQELLVQGMVQKDQTSLWKTISEALLMLPINGTLYVDMKSVKYMDSDYAFMLTCVLRGAAGTGRNRGKHLFFIEPNEHVLKALEEMAKLSNGWFGAIDSQGIIKIHGSKIIPRVQEAFTLVLTSPKNITSEMLSGKFPQKAESLTNCLRKLYDHGFICRRITKSRKGGRGQNEYFPYFPTHQQFWPTANLKWEVPMGNANSEPIYIPVPAETEL